MISDLFQRKTIDILYELLTNGLRYVQSYWKFYVYISLFLQLWYSNTTSNVCNYIAKLNFIVFMASCFIETFPNWFLQKKIISENSRNSSCTFYCYVISTDFIYFSISSMTSLLLPIRNKIEKWAAKVLLSTNFGQKLKNNLSMLQNCSWFYKYGQWWSI